MGRGERDLRERLKRGVLGTRLLVAVLLRTVRTSCLCCIMARRERGRGRDRQTEETEGGREGESACATLLGEEGSGGRCPSLVCPRGGCSLAGMVRSREEGERRGGE